MSLEVAGFKRRFYKLFFSEVFFLFFFVVVVVVFASKNRLTLTSGLTVTFLPPKKKLESQNLS